MHECNMHETVLKYEYFINDILKEDLKEVELRLQEVTTEISDLIQQKHSLKCITDKKIHPNGFKTQVNLACNFFMEAAVPDTSKILLNIGLNHYIEFSIQEANKYLDMRTKAYQRKEEELRNKSAETKAHIKLLLFHLAEIRKDPCCGIDSVHHNCQ